MTQRASSEARKTATSAMSSGAPTRPRGVWATMPFSMSEPAMPPDWVPSVTTSPGLRALTRIFWGPSSLGEDGSDSVDGVLG